VHIGRGRDSNALLDAARQMGAFRPQPQFLPVSTAAGGFVITDPGGAVPLGETLPVLRPVGRFKGLSGPVMVPVGTVTVRDAGTGEVTATDGGIVPLKLQGGEVVGLETAGNPARSRRTIAQCTDATGAPRVDDRGPLPVPFWQRRPNRCLRRNWPRPSVSPHCQQRCAPMRPVLPDGTSLPLQFRARPTAAFCR